MTDNTNRTTIKTTSSIREAFAPNQAMGVSIRTFVICIAALGLMGLTVSVIDAPTDTPTDAPVEQLG